jgi:Tfp pilus assembly protein PilN
MREMEFLPAWYPQLRRQKRTVMLALWATLLVAGGFSFWIFLARQNIQRRQADRAVVALQLDQSRKDLRELNNQLSEKADLESKQRVVAKIGLHVEVARLLAKLDQIMPREMTLTEANFDTMEAVRPVDPSSTDHTQKVDRKLIVKLSGITPSDADWASVLAKLSSVPFFQDVRLVGAHEKVDSGHVMRQFEVSFVVDLGNGG